MTTTTISNRSNSMRTVFFKLRNGTWGIRGTASNLTLDSVVEVTKNDGTAHLVRVETIVWTGPDARGNDVTIATYSRVSRTSRAGLAFDAARGRANLIASTPRVSVDSPTLTAAVQPTVAEITASAQRGEVVALTGPNSLLNAIVAEREQAAVSAAQSDEVSAVLSAAFATTVAPSTPVVVRSETHSVVGLPVVVDTVRLAPQAAPPVVVDATSYRADLPSWEPTFNYGTRSNMLMDGGEHNRNDLSRIGKRILRRDDNGTPIAVNGLDYTVETHRQIASVLDAVTSWCGGRGALGAARVDVVDDVILWINVKLPRTVGALLSVDGNERDVTLTYTTSHDGSRKFACALYVSRVVAGRNVGAFMHGRGAKLLAGAHRHTAGLTDFLSNVRDAGEGIPQAIGEHAAMLRRMHSRPLTVAQVKRACDVIQAVKADDVATARRDDTAGRTAQGRLDRSAELARLVARMPSTDAAHPASRTALQVFDAACTWDVTMRTTQQVGATDAAHRHETRSLAGDTAERKAWDLLTADALNLGE